MARTFQEKILSIVWLKGIAADERRAIFSSSRDSCALTTGVFDMLHGGHLRYLQVAGQFSRRLVVGVSSDARVRKMKGLNRPILTQDERVEIVAALECVDFALVFDDMKELIDVVQPDVLVASPTTMKDPNFDKFAYMRQMHKRVELVREQSHLHTSDYLQRILARFLPRMQ